MRMINKLKNLIFINIKNLKEEKEEKGEEATERQKKKKTLNQTELDFSSSRPLCCSSS